jgi:hypothetical protein
MKQNMQNSRNKISSRKRECNAVSSWSEGASKLSAIPQNKCDCSTQLLCVLAIFYFYWNKEPKEKVAPGGRDQF